jgi:hypothetical protein
VVNDWKWVVFRKGANGTPLAIARVLFASTSSYPKEVRDNEQ